MQMAITQRIYYDFVVWSQSNHFIVTVEFDREFYSKMDSLTHFFLYGMPEIVGKWYTRKPISAMENIIHTPSSPTAQNVDQEGKRKITCGVTVTNSILGIWCAVKMTSVLSNGFISKA